MDYFNYELLAALVGGLVAFISPYILEGAWAEKRRGLRVRRFSPSRCVLAMWATALGGSCVHGAKQAVQTTFTVTLKRETLPLHSSEDGVVQHRSAYFGMIGLGYPNPQYFDVVFDTGSGHVIVPSSLCKTASCQKHKKYKRKGSKTSVDVDYLGIPKDVKGGEPRDMLSVAFGTGEVSGVFMKEYVCLGSREERETAVRENTIPEFAGRTQGPSLLQRSAAQTGTVTLQEETSKGAMDVKFQQRAAAIDKAEEALGKSGCSDVSFIYATDMTSEPFESLAFDGIVGLGLTALSESESFNLMQVMAGSGAWMSTPGYESVFSVFLGFSEEEPSEITFGGMNPERLVEGAEVAYHKVQEPELGYWQIRVDGIRVNGKSLDFCDDGSCRAIWDTGTSLVAVPRDIGDVLVDSLRYQSSSESCNGTEAELEFDVGGRLIALTPADFFRPEFTLDQWWQSQTVLDENETTALQNDPLDRGLALPSGQTRYCVPMLMSLALDDPLSKKTFIFGEPVMQKYYAVFNATPESPSIGFAKAHHTVEQRPREEFLKQQ